jgi:hypothetical protein
MGHATTESPEVDVTADREVLYRDGIVALKGAFSRDWTERMREDMMTAFWEAIQRPGGAVGRGPFRWYVEIHPQAFSGFADLCAHPWVAAMCRDMLGPEYKIVEIGFDTPFEGAMNQPWHRDFPSPPETWRDRRITSLAFNLTGVDVTPDMGPFEIAAGTQWDDGRAWKHEMFPAEEVWPRFAERGVRKFPQDGRHLLSLCADRPSRHDASLANCPSGPGARRRRARRGPRHAARSYGDAGLLRRAARGRAGPSRMQGGRPADPRHAEARHRGARNGGGVSRPGSGASCSCPRLRPPQWFVGTPDSPQSPNP